MNRTDFSLRSNRHDGGQVGKRQERIRAHGPTGRVAGAATEMLSGSQPSSSTACPAYVLPESPCPGAPDANSAPGHQRRSPRRAVSSPEVVGRGHEAPFGARGGPAAAVKAAEAAVVFGVAEDRLDELAALAVEHASTFGCEDAAHEVVGAAVPARAWARVASAA